MRRKLRKQIIKQVQTGLLSLALVITQVVPVGLMPATAVAAPSPTQIAFSSGAEQTGAVAEKINFQVQTQDNTNTSSPVSDTTRLYLTSTSETGEFYSGTTAGECNTDTPVEYVAVSSGSSNRAFCYSNSQDGEYTISVEAKDSDDISLGWEILSGVATIGMGVISLPEESEEIIEVCVVENTTQDFCREDLKTAIADSDEGDRLQLNQDTSVTEQARLKEGMTLDGQGFTLTSPFARTNNSNNSTLYTSNNVTIQNIVLDGSESTNLHGINTYKHTNVLIQGATLKNYRSGLVVNGSEVTVRDISTSGNAWHGINVDQGSGVSEPSILTVEGTSSHTDAAHIYLDKYATADVTVNDTNNQYDTAENVAKAGDKLYTLKSPDTTKPVVSLLTTLQEFYRIRDLSLELKATDEQSGIGQFSANIRKNGVQFRSCVNQNGGGAREVLAGCNLTNLEDALYQIRSNALDVAGNRSNSVIEEFVVDTTNPRVRIANLSDGEVITSSTDVVVTLDDLGGSPLKGELEIQVMTGSESETGTFSTGTTVYSTTKTFDPSAETYTFTLADLQDFEDGLYRIRVRADDMAGNRGRNHRYIYVDNTGPVVSDVLLNGVEVDNTHIRTANCEAIKNPYPVRGNIDFSARVEDELSDVNSVRYSIRKVNPNGCSNTGVYNSGRTNLQYDEGRWVTGSAFDTTQIEEDGEYTIIFLMRDALGNASMNYVDILVDNTRPIVEITSEVQDYYKDGEIEVEVTANDTGSGVGQLVANIRKNGSHYRPCINKNGEGAAEFVYSCTLNVSDLEDAVYQIRTNARDLAGNMSTTVTQEFGVDTVQPGLTIDSPTNNSYVSASSVTVDGMVSDDMSGVDRVELRVNKITGLGGSHAGSFLGQTLLDVSEDGMYTYDVTDLMDGTYRFQVRVYDNAGNRRIRYVDVVVDTTAPVATIVSPENEEMLKGMIAFEGEVEDANPSNTHWEIRNSANKRVAHDTKRDGRTTHMFEWDSTTVDDGIYTVYFETRDKAGNKDGSKTSAGDSVAMIEITVKNTPPAAPVLTSPSDNAVVQGSLLTNSWSSVSDAVKYVYQSFHDAAATNLRWEEVTTNISKSASNVADSVFWWRVRAVDQVDNESDWSDLWKVTIDNTAPADISGLRIVAGDRDVSGGFINGDERMIRIEWDSNEEADYDENFSHFEYKNRAGIQNVGSRNSFTGLLGGSNPVEGTYTYEVRAIDQAGNKGDWAEVSVTLDMTAPVVELIQPSDGDVVTGTVEVRGSVEDDNLLRYYTVVQKDGSVIDGPGTVYRDDAFSDEVLFTWDTTTVEDGEYIIRLSARDKADNKDDNSLIDITVTVDNSIAAIVSATERVSTLKTALESGGLVDTFFNNGEDKYTVFAPINEAFEGVDLSEISPENLVKILTYHVVEGPVLAGELTNGQVIPTLSKTESGEFRNIIVLINEDGTFIEFDEGKKAQIVKTDIKASNGVIHLIGEVLLPNDEISGEAAIDGVPAEGEENTFRPGTTVTRPDGITVVIIDENGDERVLEEGEVVTLSEDGTYTITSTDRFGRSTSRTIVIEAATEPTPVNENPRTDENGLGGSNEDSDNSTPTENDQRTRIPSEPQTQQGGSDENTSTTSGGGSDTGSDESSAPDNDLSPIALETGSSTFTGESTAQPFVPSNTISGEATTEETPSEESTDDADGTDTDADEDSEDEDNGLAANIGEFIGGWFSTWWGWLISLAVLIFLIFLIIRRKEEE